MIRRYLLVFGSLVLAAICLISCDPSLNAVDEDAYDAYIIYSQALEKYLSNTNRAFQVCFHQEYFDINTSKISSINSVLDIKYVNDDDSARKIEVKSKWKSGNDEEYVETQECVYIDNMNYQIDKSFNSDSVRYSKIQYSIREEVLTNMIHVGLFTELSYVDIRKFSSKTTNGMIELSFTLGGGSLAAWQTSFNAIDLEEAECNIVIDPDGQIKSTSCSFEYKTKDANGDIHPAKYFYTMDVLQYGGVIIETPNPAEYEDVSEFLVNNS